jgi:hypothetical protein
VVTRLIGENLLADHEGLERLFGRLPAALAAARREQISKLWTARVGGLRRHLEAEERHFIPAYLGARKRDAWVLIQEHRHLRARLTELDAAVGLHRLRLDSTRNFVDELRAHTRNEERLLYRWADARLEESCGAACIDLLRKKSTS